MTKRTRLSIEALDDRCLPSFSPATSLPVGPNPRDVVTADFNNDGRLDLATANADGNSVSVLLGNGDGTFRSPLNSTAGVSPEHLTVADFNHDGALDLATANDYDVSVLLGNGDGTFQSAASLSLGSDPLHPVCPMAVAAGDFNGDGALDLGVTSSQLVEYDDGSGYYAGSANVLLGRGDGTFEAPVTSPFGNSTALYQSSAVVTDFNGDGLQDFATGILGMTWDWDFYGVARVLLGDGTGHLSGGGWFRTNSGSEPRSVVAGDVNGDGKADLVTANYENSVSVLLGDGVGGFATAQLYAAGGRPDSVALGDFNNDSRPDIATANSDSNTMSVLRGLGGGAFSTPQTFAVGTGPEAVAAGDFSGDGWLDAATANIGGTVSVLLNDGAWGAPPPPPPPPALRIGDRTVTEGNTGTASASFTVTLSAASSQTITVAYSTGNGSAAAGSDYQAASGTLTFAPGETTKTITVQVLGDRLGEPNETFVVNLSGPTNATVADGQGVGTITDDEPRVSIGDVTRAEGNAGQTTLFTFTVTLSAPYDQAVTMSFRTENGTAKANQGDYVSRTGTLTFAPGETTKTITIEVNGDNKREADETFYLDLFGLSSNALLIDGRGIGTIVNDD